MPPSDSDSDSGSVPSRVDPSIWRACAGASVQIPPLHSRVYYFPQGHFEQASSPPDPKRLSPLLLSRPSILCRVADLQFLADPLTEELSLKLLLHPLPAADGDNSFPLQPVVDDDEVVSFPKILTPSEAFGVGTALSVPKFCADFIFPALNLEADPSFQDLSLTDVHGVAWKFRHIFRGTPRRHLLITGWPTFARTKNLNAGDSVVFGKNSKGQMFVGIRRRHVRNNRVQEEEQQQQGERRISFSWGNGNENGLLIGGVRNKRVEEEEEEEWGFLRRNRKGTLSVEAVAKPAELAAHNKAFEVVYYPRAGWLDYVVKAEVVDKAMSVVWSPRMRVKMAVESVRSSRVTWFQGTVSSVSAPDNDNGYWPGSPWRMLEITWDEPEVLHNAKWVSPWQVEHVSTTPASARYFMVAG